MSIEPGLGPKKLYASVTVSLPLLRAPSQWSFARVLRQSKLSENDKVVNEIKLDSVHRFPEIHFMTEENPRKTSARR